MRTKSTWYSPIALTTVQSYSIGADGPDLAYSSPQMKRGKKKREKEESPMQKMDEILRRMLNTPPVQKSKKK